ncbi:MAG: hypothetical protein AAF394_05375 [Planctomycetota bacterium]
MPTVLFRCQCKYEFKRNKETLGSMVYLVYFALFGGIALAAYSLTAGFFVVGARSHGVGREVLGFFGPVLGAACIGICCSWLDNDDDHVLPFVTGAAYCVATGTLFAAFVRVVFRAIRGDQFGIVFLFRFSTYCAVPALLASTSALQPYLAQLTLATLILCIVYFAIFGVSYRRFLEPKSRLFFLYFPINYGVTISVLIVVRGILETWRRLCAMGPLEHLIVACFPLSFLFVWVGSKSMKKFLIKERQDWFIAEYRSRNTEDSQQS